MATTVTKQLKTYLESYGAVQARRSDRDPVWLGQMREAAWAHFYAEGFPTVHEEAWRYTNLAALAKNRFLRPSMFSSVLTKQEVDRFIAANASCCLVFVNGRFAPELSRLSSLPQGVEICPLERAIDCGMDGHAPGGCAAEGIEQHLGRCAESGKNALVALNTALWEDGAYLRVRRGANVDSPVYLLYITAGVDVEVTTQPRTLIVAEPNSCATVIEDFVSVGGEAAFTNAVTEAIVGQDAILSHYFVERENLSTFHVSMLGVEQARGSSFSSHSILLGGGLVRNEVHPVLNGEGAECLLNGLYVGEANQHVDNYMLVEHASPQCGSRQYFNGILGGAARGVFHGRIVVHKDAQKTDAKQTNRNLLLSDKARIDTKPQLEIHADDVKCTHGAAIGQIEPDQLFYLRARGVDESTARGMLLYAFAAEFLDRMKPQAARDYAEDLIRERLAELVPVHEKVAAVAKAPEGVRCQEGAG